MRYSSDRSFRRQFEFLRRQFLLDGELPFADVLSRDMAHQRPSFDTQTGGLLDLLANTRDLPTGLVVIRRSLGHQ